MAVRIQLRRGNHSEFSGSLVLTAGEAALVEDEKVLIVGDGSSTYTQLKAAGKFINYQTEQGLGTVGGSNGTSEIPIKLVGASGQAVAALQVLKNGGSNGILEVFTDNTTELVKINGADGAVDDISLLLKAKASQTAGVLEVQDSAGTTPRFQVKEEGQTLVQPDNTTDVSLDVRGSSGSQSSGIMRVRQGSNDVLVVKSDGVTSKQNVTADGVSIIAQADGDATSNVTLVGSDDAAVKAITVDDGGTENFSVTASGAIATNSTVTAEGKGTFADLEIDVTGRTLAAASLLRRDEIQSSLNGFRKYQYNLSGLANSTEKIVKLTATSDSSSVLDYKLESIGSIVARTTAVNTTDPNPDLQFTPGSSVFEAILLKPNEIARFNLSCAYSHGTVARTTRMTTIRYSSADLSTGKTDLTEEFKTQTGSGTFTLDQTYLNTTSSDIYIALSSECSTATARNITGDVHVGVAAPIAVAVNFTPLT
jgi:hypothetical protein